MSTFTIRVYGILEDANRILISNEYFHGKHFTKFPGGGLEWGEGTLECLKREFMEEMNLEIEVGEHFYTTDFFVQSDFNHEVQVMNVFYKVKTENPEKIKVSPRGTLPHETHNAAVFIWMEKSEIHPDLFTYPIEKRVAELLSQEIKL